MSKILTLAATGLAGVVLGAGTGTAAAGDGTPRTAERPPATDMAPMDMTSMDMGSMDMGAMHAQMRDQMPAGMAERCDEMHAAMASHMSGNGHGPMSGADRDRADHDKHHPGQED
jgi:hypothetical protein